MPENKDLIKALDTLRNVNSKSAQQVRQKLLQSSPQQVQGYDVQKTLEAVNNLPDFKGKEELRSKITSGYLEQQQFQKSLNPFGMDPEQLQKLIEVLNQNIGASKELNTAVKRQAIAGQPKAVQQAAATSGENQLLQSLTRAISNVQAQGIDQQQNLIAGVLQRELQKQQIAAANQQNLVQVLGQLGIEVGTRIAGAPNGG